MRRTFKFIYTIPSVISYSLAVLSRFLLEPWAPWVAIPDPLRIWRLTISSYISSIGTGRVRDPSPWLHRRPSRMKALIELGLEDHRPTRIYLINSFTRRSAIGTAK
jgi:hypothetical protein